MIKTKCSILLFELTHHIEKQAYEDVLNRSYDRAIQNGRNMYESDFGHVDESLMKKGLYILYHDEKKKKVRLIVSPSWVIGGELNELWKPSADNIALLCGNLEKWISLYFNKGCGLDDFKRSRIIFATDMDMGNSSKVFDYIKILHSIGRVKCFSPIKRNQNGEKIQKERCFALKGNSNGVEFWAHQLKYQKSILRAEVRLSRPDTIRTYSSEVSVLKQIRALAESCKPIFMDTFRYIIPPGEYYKKPKAENLIRERVPDAQKRRRMLRLLALIPEKKSLHLALKSLNYRNFMDVLLDFEEIGISPITIGKRHDVKILESLYSYL